MSTVQDCADDRGPRPIPVDHERGLGSAEVDDTWQPLYDDITAVHLMLITAEEYGYNEGIEAEFTRATAAVIAHCEEA